jgi:hypothetical protein
MYDISILVNRAAERGWLPIDIFRAIQDLPKKERISSASVYRVFQYGLGRPGTLRPICKVLGLELKDIVVRQVRADLPEPKTAQAEHSLVLSSREKHQ